ncbi:MAG TPA: aldo/keto reductase, partial [Solirubrobacteraceae bacterium]|nr:aldo/keto reductase [Solirubrobacteraceae bacterium]
MTDDDPTWRPWTRRIAHGFGRHGDVGHVRPRRARREHRDHPCGARRRHQLLDTGDFYGMGHNEMLIGEALSTRNRDEAVISVKFGAQRGPDGAWLGYDARPAAVKTAVAYSLQRLRTDHIDVYRPARLDQQVPIEETIGAIAEMVQAGYVRYIGLSEVGSDTIRRAAAVHPICDLQIEYSLISRGIERGILDTCRESGIAITAYGVLSRGLISGHWSPERSLVQTDFRNRSPRFQGENLTR